jgi:hypothetical protein
MALRYLLCVVTVMRDRVVAQIACDSPRDRVANCEEGYRNPAARDERRLCFGRCP